VGTYSANGAGCSIVHLGHALCVWSSTLSSGTRTACKHVASNEGEILDQLASLRVGQEELSEGTKVLDTLFTVAARIFLAGNSRIVRNSTLGILDGAITELFR
jgi:hypothetical protein